MRCTSTILLAALTARILAHGVVTEIQGANGVTMPGLSVIDGTPRDCASPLCGSEEDTSIIRDSELGTSEASALGKTNGGGPVDAAAAISLFMTGSSTGTTAKARKLNKLRKSRRGVLGDLLGGGSSSDVATGTGVKAVAGAVESGLSKAAGTGAKSGLPTVGDDGTISMTFHQVNQDGAGPLSAAIDTTSGGTDPNAFVDAPVTLDVPGIGFGGLSGATTTDFPIKVQMPAGATCDGTAAGVNNVCVVRVRNSALAGPFGGSAAFTQTKAARKRAIEYRLRKMRMVRGIEGPKE